MLLFSILFFSHVSYSVLLNVSLFFFFKQKTAYEMRISDWSSDVCSSDLLETRLAAANEALADAHAADKGWKRATIEKAARDAFARAHKGVKIDALHLVQVIDKPGVDADEAVFHEIGRASCRERVGQYVEISVVAGSLKKKKNTTET